MNGPWVAIERRHLADRGFGEALLAWRCGDRGAVDDLESVPASSPDCEAPREHLFYCIED